MMDCCSVSAVCVNYAAVSKQVSHNNLINFEKYYCKTAPKSLSDTHYAKLY